MCFLGHISEDEDELAGLALISSIRKRVMNLPGDLAADKEWRVRLTIKACVDAKDFAVKVSWCLPRSALCQPSGHPRMLQTEVSRQVSESLEMCYVPFSYSARTAMLCLALARGSFHELDCHARLAASGAELRSKLCASQACLLACVLDVFSNGSCCGGLSGSLLAGAALQLLPLATKEDVTAPLCGDRPYDLARTLVRLTCRVAVRLHSRSELPL